MSVNIDCGSESLADHVRVQETHIGRAVFANRSYQPEEMIGEITGVISDGSDVLPDYTFDFEDDLVLDPYPPFRFLNHCCDPSCEFQMYIEECEDGGPDDKKLYLFAAREIKPGDELTIDYCWPAEDAIPCLCQSPKCRGWVVDEAFLDDVVKNQ